MGSGDQVSGERRRLLEAFGYQWTENARTWVNEAGSPVSEDTLAAWTLDELREWLTKGARPRQGG